MAWNDRLKPAAYTSPSGVRIEFQYENIQRQRTKNTSSFDFPDARGTLVQDCGSSSHRFPIRIFFSGPNYDLEADQFEAAVFEQGFGKLELPLYPKKDVVPFGDFVRRDDLKTAANQAVIQMTFYETVLNVYPVDQSDPSTEMTLATNKLNSAMAEQYANVLDTSNEGLIAKMTNKVNDTLDVVESNLQTLADAQADVQKQFNEINQSINRSVDVLIRDPLNLAFSTVQLIQSPARSAALIADRLEGYAQLASDIVSPTSTTPYDEGFDASNSNDFHTDDLTVSSAVSGSVISVQNNEFETKTGAIEAAESVEILFDKYVQWRDTNFGSLNQIDTGESYQALQKLVALAVGYLIQVSFTLKQEKRLVLARDRNIVELAGELYGEIDEKLDFLINTNNLSGSQILELKAGTSIVYYN